MMAFFLSLNYFFNAYIKSLKIEKMGLFLVNIIVQIIVYAILFFLLDKLCMFFIEKSFGKKSLAHKANKKRAETIRTLLRNITRYAMFFFYIYTVLSALHFPISTLIAGASIVTLVIGLGAQGIIKDLIAGFLILLEQQMIVGDNVTINGTISGKVIGFGLRLTTIQDEQGGINYIKNSSITTVTNRSGKPLKIMIDLPVKDNSLIDSMKQIINKVNINQKDKLKLTDNISILGPLLVEDKIIIRVVVFSTLDFDQVKTTLNSEYINAIKNAGIDLM